VWPVHRVADALAAKWGKNAGWQCNETPSVHEAHTLKLDASKARDQLKWKPRLAIDLALQWTVDWFRAWAKGEPMREQSESQICAYERLLQ
jgi:CDP-glucose 4,6-dehydratase